MIASHTLRIGKRVWVNWREEDKYYDAYIRDVKDTGYVVEYLDYNGEEDQFEHGVLRENIIGNSVCCALYPNPSHIRTHTHLRVGHEGDRGDGTVHRVFAHGAQSTTRPLTSV